MGRVTVRKGDEPFTRPSGGLVDHAICMRTGRLALTGCDSVLTEVFLADSVPKDKCNVHGGRLVDEAGGGRDFKSVDRGGDEF
jgi:hypothetical protein